MAKNMIRKGLATGAGLALVSVGLVAGPAVAAPTLTIAPNAGTSTKVLASDDFTVKVFSNSEYTWSATTSALRWEIEQNAAQTVNVDDAASYSSALSAGSDSTTTKKWYTPATVSATPGANVLSINPVGNSTFKSSQVKVRAYIELDGTNGFTSGDLGSNQLTIDFLGSADLNAALSLSSYFIGDNQTYVATIDGINYHQANDSTDDIQMKEIDNGTEGSSLRSMSANTAKTAFTFTHTNAAVAGDVMGGNLYAAEYDGQTAAKLVATSGSVGVTTSTVNSVDDMTIARDATIRSNSSDYVDHSSSGSDVDSAQEFVAKKGTTSFTVTATLTDSNSQPIAGAPVNVKVIEDTMASVALGTTISSGGESFTTASATATESLTRTATANSAGEVSVTVTSSTGAVGDIVEVIFDIGAAQDEVVVGWKANGINKIVVTSNPGEGVIEAVTGNTLSATVAVLDDFGANWVDADNEYRISTSQSGTSSAAIGEVAYNGSPVTVSWTDASAAGGALTAVHTLQKKGSSAWATATNAGGSNISTASTVFEMKTASAPGTTVTASVTAGTGADAYVFGTSADVPLTLKAYANVDRRLSNAPAAITSSLTNRITGTVLSANGALTDGVVVTATSAGVGFKVGDVWSSGSATFRTNASGAFDIEVFSNQTGTKTITIASGSGSKDVKIKYVAADDSTGTTLTISAPDTVQAGSTLVATALLTDKFGNPIDVAAANANAGQDFAFSSDSPGVQVGSNPDETGADGTAKLQYLLGSNDDSGTITITASYDKNGDEDYADFGDLVVIKTVTIGTVTSDYGTVSAWTKDMGDGTAKVYVKFPTIGDKVRIGHQTGGSGSYETIFVKTIASESDSALTVNSNGSYIVRTIDLEDINRIRVTVGDERLVQVRYNQ